MNIKEVIRHLKCKFRYIRIVGCQQNKCIECGAYHGHTPICSLMSRAYAKSELKRYYKEWLKSENSINERIQIAESRAQLEINKAKTTALAWEAKYRIVKHENNILRKNKYPNKA